MIEQTNCPICKRELKNLFTTKDYLVSKDNFDIMECPSCRLGITSPFPEKDIIGSYYESDEYISHSDQTRSLFDGVYKMVRSIMLSKKRRLVESALGRKTGKLLDMGCGTGHFLNMMKSNGWDVAGIDASIKARTFVKNQFGISVNSQTEWLNSDEKYDIITCWHSLEHVHEPWIYLEKIRMQLNTNGVLIAALPNYESTDADKYGADWAAYDVPRHLYHFSPHSAEKIMTGNGFSIMDIRRMQFDGFYVSMLSAQHRGQSAISGLWNGLVSWVSSLLNKEKCSSLIYVMK
ncbi:MAG: class I SAM-dependent methyltransferase [Fidelibacterota bacterium]